MLLTNYIYIRNNNLNYFYVITIPINVQLLMHAITLKILSVILIQHFECYFTKTYTRHKSVNYKHTYLMRVRAYVSNNIVFHFRSVKNINDVGNILINTKR